MSINESHVEAAAFKWFKPGEGLSLADLFHALSSCNLKTSSRNLPDRSRNLAANCRNLDAQIVVVQSLVMLPDRLPETLQRQYLSPMCRTRKLEMAFPDAPNDSRQTYTTRKP